MRKTKTKKEKSDIRQEEFEDLLYDLRHGARKLPETGEIMLEAALKVAAIAPVPEDLFAQITTAQKDGIFPTSPVEHHELHLDNPAD